MKKKKKKHFFRSLTKKVASPAVKWRTKRVYSELSSEKKYKWPKISSTTHTHTHRGRQTKKKLVDERKKRQML